METPLQILVVEDSILNFTTFSLLLKKSSLNIISVTNTTTLSETISFLQTNKPDIIFLDLNLPDCSGLESFKPLKEFTLQIATVVLTAHNDIDTSVKALRFGAQDYLVKDNFNINTLDKTILFSIARKKAEVEALVLEERYRQIFYENSMPMFIVDSISQQFLECNDAAVLEYGYSRDEFLRLEMRNIWQNKNIKKGVEAIIQSNGSKKYQRHKKKDGHIIFVNVSICNVIYEQRTVYQIQVQNITQQILLQQALKKEQQEKEFQIRKAANDAQEKERYNIGVELHENVNQILAASLLYLDNFVNSKKTNPSMATACKEHIVTAMKEVNALSRNLIPPLYINEDFIGSLKEILIPIQKTNILEIQYNISNTIDASLNKQQKLAVFRIIQEQLNNILKHAEATVAAIQLDITGNQLTLSITDNGKGCILKKPKKGLGLHNIISRAELFNGAAKFISAPNNGFEVVVSFKII
ncbi:response regulator [Parasediminibacterium paludis]|uniref:histidine kinase n=1 Tax=Parasediminibacterium paludis TaxID=908966 RepID=A0ABV8PZ26_9BACT